MLDPAWLYRCPTCQQEITGTSRHVDIEDVYPMEPMWPGGPPVQASMLPESQRVTGERTTFQPCGHVVEGTQWTVTATRRGERVT